MPMKSETEKILVSIQNLNTHILRTNERVGIFPLSHKDFAFLFFTRMYHLVQYLKQRILCKYSNVINSIITT